MKSTRFSSKYKWALGGLLILASMVSLALVEVHARMNGADRYNFLIDNLGLAWIPLIAAVVASAATRNKITYWLLMPVCTLVWLIFFPNAPYMLTDFQHLAYPIGGNAPLWIDVILMIWFAWTGLLLGVTSLFLMQEIVTRLMNSFFGWVFAIGITILSSMGVYLGRFMRWNSLDLLENPFSIAKDMYGIVRDPFANKSTILFVILFTLLFLFIYLAVHLFAGAICEREQNVKR